MRAAREAERYYILIAILAISVVEVVSQSLVLIAPMGAGVGVRFYAKHAVNTSNLSKNNQKEIRKKALFHFSF